MAYAPEGAIRAAASRFVRGDDGVRLPALRPGAEGGLRRALRAGAANGRSPAVIGAIISQQPSVGTREFTATLFDLIRRDVLSAQPVSVKKDGLWGEKTMTDLRVDLGSYDRGSLQDQEARVLNVAHRVLSCGPVNLTDFEEHMKDGGEHDRRANRSSYKSFLEPAPRRGRLERRDLVERRPGCWVRSASLLWRCARGRRLVRVAAPLRRGLGSFNLADLN